MKFGAVAIDDATGAILAHSIEAGGHRYSKGKILQPADISALQTAGVAHVTVARLEAGDVGEDCAAEILANAIVPQPDRAGVRLSQPFTGRVNLYSTTCGIARIDADALRAGNLVDPMITAASVAPNVRTRAGGMLATIKIISYGVSGERLARAAGAMAGAVAVRAPIYKTASLILTRISGGGVKGEEKGTASVRGRLAALGIALEDVTFCAHTDKALARAIDDCTGEMVLILTASATSDILDVGPEALRRAGGQVTRYGIPVDPGNLLFYGDVGKKPVIGLPGCARSPALNGADWVLDRIACGVNIDATDIAAMAVGGLLKEIPTRPQPRERQ